MPIRAETRWRHLLPLKIFKLFACSNCCTLHRWIQVKPLIGCCLRIETASHLHERGRWLSWREINTFPAHLLDTTFAFFSCFSVAAYFLSSKGESPFGCCIRTFIIAAMKPEGRRSACLGLSVCFTLVLLDEINQKPQPFTETSTGLQQVIRPDDF